LTGAELADYQEGWERFARRQFWHAHESWERLWRRQQDPVRGFLQGLIQLTAAYFLLLGEGEGADQKRLTRPLLSRFHGALRNFDKAAARLQGFPATYLHVEVAALRQTLDSARSAILALGPERLAEFPDSFIVGVPRLPPAPG
jgi:predicted metal-dependent hydrolase